MKIVEAVLFSGVVKAGGSTKPWRVQASDREGGLAMYIVKLFTESHTSQYHPAAKEVFGTVLAREFDLNVPDFALVNFSEQFIQQLPPPETTRLQKVADGLKFGSVEVPGASIVDINRQRSLAGSYDIGTIFAFDNLIWNLDRGGFRNKPNTLINDENLILIDHEQLFPFADDVQPTNAYVMPPLNRSDWYYPYDRHLFYSLLKRMNAVEKAHVFDTFEYFLRNLSLGTLDAAAHGLMQLGIQPANYSVIRKHLLETKARAGEFCQLLLTLIA